MFFVFNKPNDEGFHEIKNEAGDVIATAANTDDQAITTLNVMGYKDVDIEIVYNQEQWDAL